MARKPKEQEYKDAQLSTEEIKDAIRKIDRRLMDLEAFDVKQVQERSDPKITALNIKLNELLVNIFGSDSTQYRNYQRVVDIDTAGYNMNGTPLHEVLEGLVKGVDQAKGTLGAIKEGFEEQLEDAGESDTGRPLRAYDGLDLHAEINRQVGKLYRDGHYAEAVVKSVMVLNNLVRMRSGEELDGTPLMLKVFSAKNPILKFNNLADQSDKDEQMGYMNLFAGAVMGLRNPRAHRLMKDDPERALEFIAFVSLLAKLVDETNY